MRGEYFMKNKTITIKDVAKLANVSPSTVSRVINGKDVISEDTRKIIMSAMQELNYFPNSQARNLAHGNSYAIGLVIDASDNNTFSNTFFNRSVFGIETVAQKYGFNVLITNDLPGENNISSVEKLVLERKVDGLILPPSTVKKKLISKLLELDFPFVVLGEPSIFKMESSWVDVNNIQGGELAVSHLIRAGYKRIAFLSGNPNTTFSKNRKAGYLKGLENAGIAIDESLIVVCDPDSTGSQKVAAEILQRNYAPDAFVCSDNIISFGVLSAAAELGIAVPQQLGVVTFDNYPIAEYTSPPLTAVDVDTFSLGEQAASILLKKVQRDKDLNQQILISTKLIERTSTSRKE